MTRIGEIRETKRHRGARRFVRLASDLSDLRRSLQPCGDAASAPRPRARRSTRCRGRSRRDPVPFEAEGHRGALGASSNHKGFEMIGVSWILGPEVEYDQYAVRDLQKEHKRWPDEELSRLRKKVARIAQADSRAPRPRNRSARTHRQLEVRRGGLQFAGEVAAPVPCSTRSGRPRRAIPCRPIVPADHGRRVRPGPSSAPIAAATRGLTDRCVYRRTIRMSLCPPRACTARSSREASATAVRKVCRAS